MSFTGKVESSLCQTCENERLSTQLKKKIKWLDVFKIIFRKLYVLCLVRTLPIKVSSIQEVEIATPSSPLMMATSGKSRFVESVKEKKEQCSLR